jgi:hypothetical protein
MVGYDIPTVGQYNVPLKEDQMPDADRIAVYGATGYTGRQVVEELARRGAAPVLVGRDRHRLETVAASAAAAEVHVAALDDPDALCRAFEGCSAVINAVGPFATSAEPIIAAAVDASAHYLDFTAEQEVVLDLYESWDQRAREAGIAVLPAMGFYGALGDLLAAHIAGERPSESVTIAYAVDGWLLTAGSRETAGLLTGQRRAWRNGTLVRGEPRYGTYSYPGRGEERVMEDYPLPEAVLVPRHVSTPDLRLVMSVSTLAEIFGPDAVSSEDAEEEERAGSRFLVVVEAEAEERTRRIVASGRDIYGITAPIITEGALRLLGSGLSGALAPAQAFDAAEFLATLVPRWLTLEPPPPSGRRPADSDGFVLAAEQATNERDAVAAASLYAEGATLEVITDGKLARFLGLREITTAWQRYMHAIEQTGLVVRKQLLAAEPATIVNEWRGVARGAEARGTEAWFFDEHGKVREHRMLTSLAVRA